MELVSAIISAPYFDRWIPSKDTRDIENLPNCIDPFQLAYIVTPSDEMDATLRKAQERVAYPPIDWTNEDVRRRHKEMGPFTEMYFLARQDTDMPLPSIGEGVSGPRWMPKYPSRLPDGQLDERFFIDWWQNIYREFIETEGFASCYRLLEKTLKRALKKEQSIDAFVEKFKKQMPQANGLVGMSLNALKGKDALMREKYPQWSEFIDALQRQINTAPGQ